MNGEEQRRGFANAELHRRFNNLLLDGDVNAVDTTNNLVDVNVSTASGEFIASGLPLINVNSSQVSEGMPVVIFSAQGAIETGLVYVLGPDPEQVTQNERIKSLESEVESLKQQLSSLNYNNN